MYSNQKKKEENLEKENIPTKIVEWQNSRMAEQEKKTTKTNIQNCESPRESARGQKISSLICINFF